MSEDALRRLLDTKWAALDAEQVSHERRMRVSELPAVGAQGPLAVAVDHGGHRHLLVPIHANRKVRRGLDGPVLHMRKRPLEDADTYQHYVDLACLRSDLDDLFTDMCVDVLEAVKASPGNPVRALYGVLDRWKALFQTQGPPLSVEQLAGLFGELTLLNRLLERDPSAHRLWLGPTGHRHDFSAATNAVEVKSGLAREGRRPRIHGLDQLEAPEGGTLGLVWFRLQRAGASGTALPDLVDRARGLCDDESALIGLLAAIGYHASQMGVYHEVRFVVAEECWYRVDAGFPGLTGRDLVAAGVPVSVLDVEYTIDLSGRTPPALPPDEISQIIDAMLEESV
ncbi:PD-(D/E)XK motif protein [Streptomyces sp. 549]|uniref:PD-(D/E)XK motif protein n=1 Tax=Streptomyces sp. 549 TaxID=3049076 RepID=UPI0024C2EDE4|nr:PD-(D/E)XK motif protein [Streptomyces sp. 549]MDK1475508.1 PD-(D/E)XK motif protein [Streptomyces sp. 549]